jgi:hypothetical protein
MNGPEHRTDVSQDALLALRAAPRQLAALTARVGALQAEVERRRRGAMRQAAPLSSGTRVVMSKRPGRKPGAGPFRDRHVPPPAAITAPPVDVKVTREACPTCGAPPAEERVDFGSITAPPPKPRPKGPQSRVWVGRCMLCGHQVRGQPPESALDQAGATAHRLGPRVMAEAHAWHYAVGRPGRQGPAVLNRRTGVRLTPPPCWSLRPRRQPSLRAGPAIATRRCRRCSRQTSRGRW